MELERSESGRNARELRLMTFMCGVAMSVRDIPLKVFCAGEKVTGNMTRFLLAGRISDDETASKRMLV